MIDQYVSELLASGLTYRLEAGLTYFFSDPHPEVLIASGLHGDEWPAIPLLAESVIKLRHQLPPFLFIPTLSPSAVHQRTRVNEDGIDLNRSFKEHDHSYRETEAIKQVVLQFKPLKTVLTVHQDLDQDAIYLYDGSTKRQDEQIDRWRSALQPQGFKFLTGYDDEIDPDLGIYFKDGYHYFPPAEQFIGTFETWVSLHAGASRELTLELPALLSEDKQQLIVEESLKSLL